MYVTPNFPTKKALREWLAAGRTVVVFQSGLGDVPTDGTVYLEGPHYPQPHRWYAEGTMQHGRLIKVK